MAWVTKDSVEQYETPESKKEYTKQEKAANWWYYHKLYVGIAVIAVVLVVWMVHDVVTRVRPDYRVGYVGSSNLPTDTVTALENTLAAYCDDRNGDGKVVVELVQYNLDFDSESENTDAYTQMADVTRLSADLSSEDGPYIFIMQDTDYAQQFAETTGDLQYLDGTMPDTENVDENDNVIRPAILWNDGRTIEENDYLNNVIGKDKLSSYTANISFTGFTAAKILWVKNKEPENFARIKKIMLPKDYLAYKLTGVNCTDYSDASGMLLLDVKNKCWSKEMIEICGIKEEMLPKLYESYEKVGTLKPEVAGALGLSENVIVAAGAGDNAAAAVGTGTVGDGSCNISLGTSGTIFISSDKFGVDEHNALHSFDHADGHYHLMGCMLSAASCNKWWMDEIIGTKDYAAQQKNIDKLGENSVYFLPYLMGERSPHNDSLVRGGFFGLSLDTTRADMTLAVLEGVAFAIRDSFEVAKSLGIKIERTKICGGGAKSPLWKKIIANVLNIKVDVIAAEEGPALGGAMLAAVANGEYASVKDAADAIVKVVDTVEPDEELVKKYDERYAHFVKLYPAVKGLYR